MDHLELNLQDVLWSLRKYILWILLVTVLFTAAAWAYSTQIVTPMYRATLSMCVFSSERDGAGISGSQLVSDARLANTYCMLLTSQPVMRAVETYLGGSKTAEELSAMVTAEVVTDTQFITVTVKSPEPQACLAVADAITEVAPATLSELARGGEMVAVDRAELPTAPYSPRLATNLAIGFFLGLFLSCGVVILISALDTTVWREEDLERALDIPVLGSVPSMTVGTAHTKKRRGRK